MKIARITILLLFQFCFFQGITQTFTENFNTNPCGTPFCRVTSFSITQSGVQFDINFAGGEFFHESQYGDGNSASINATSNPYDVGTTETVSFKRNDNQDFIFNSIYINNSGGETVTIQGYNNGATVGVPKTVALGGSGSFTFGGITVDEVRLTSVDFANTNFDTFSGSIPASVPEPKYQRP